MINQQQLSQALALITEAKEKIVEAELLLTSETGLHAAIKKPEKDLEFLAEINEPVEVVTDEPPPTEIPTDGELEAAIAPTGKRPQIDALIERLDLVENGVSPVLWERILKTIVIGGWDVPKLLQSSTITKDNIQLTKKEISRLETLFGIRSMIVSGEMDIIAALDQDGILAEEKKVLENFHEEHIKKSKK